MNFLLDHDVPEETYRTLRSPGHDVARARDTLAITTPDPAVFDHAQTHQQVMLTCNRRDFLQLASDRQHAGLIILIRRRSRQAEIGALVRLLRRAGETGILRNINFA